MGWLQREDIKQSRATLKWKMNMGEFTLRPDHEDNHDNQDGLPVGNLSHKTTVHAGNLAITQHENGQRQRWDASWKLTKLEFKMAENKTKQVNGKCGLAVTDGWLGSCCQLWPITGGRAACALSGCGS